MEENKKGIDYGAKALLPLLVFLVLYVGCGIVFTVLGTKEPFWQMPRYVAILIAILFAVLVFDRKKSVTQKVDIYCDNAGKPGVM